MTNLFSFTGVHLIGNAYTTTPPKQGIFDFQGNTSSNQVFLLFKFGILDYWLAFYIRICFRVNLEVLNRFPSCNIGYISNRNQIWISEVSKALILEYYLLIFSNFAKVISDILLKPIESIIISSFKQ